MTVADPGGPRRPGPPSPKVRAYILRCLAQLYIKSGVNPSRFKVGPPNQLGPPDQILDPLLDDQNYNARGLGENAMYDMLECLVLMNRLQLFIGFLDLDVSDIK